MKRSLMIAALLVAAGGPYAAAADCKREMNEVAAKCLNGSLDPLDIKRCNARSQTAYEECEAIATVQSQKTLYPQPGNQPISKPGRIVPDLDPARLDKPARDK